MESLRVDINKILQKHPHRGYDCILGISGGRDSTYLLHILSKELQLKTLTFLIKHAYLPEHSFNNVRKIAEKTGADLIIVNNNCVEKCFPVQYRAWTNNPTAKSICSFCMGCKSKIVDTYYRLSIKHKIPILMMGDTPFEWVYYKSDLMRSNKKGKIGGSFAIGYLRQVIKNPSLILNPYSFKMQLFEYLSYFGPLQIIQSLWFSKPHINPYHSYLHWNEKDIIATIQKEYSWKNWHTNENTWRTDCYIGPFRQYLYKNILGYNDKDVHFSKLIRDGQLTRDEALNRLKGEELSQEEIVKASCDKLNVNFEEVLKIISSNRYSAYGEVED